jgi:hypothetical protein
VVTVSGAGVTTSVNPLDVEFFWLSVTVTVKEYDPAVVAIPLRTPLELKLAPAGADPLRVNVKGGTPPLAANAMPMEEPACTLPKAPVVITKAAGVIVIEMVPEPLLLAESDAVTLNEYVPGVVGIPCNTPVFDICIPGGNPPAALSE